MSSDTDIRYAILHRRIVEFTYDGRLRRIEPYRYGLSTKGNPVIRGFQIGGQSNSGNPVDWRLFDLSKIKNLRITDDVFERNRSGFTPSDSQMRLIYISVS